MSTGRPRATSARRPISSARAPLAVPTVDGVTVSFEDVWSRRRVQPLGAGVQVALPSLDDLILTKRFDGRPRDLEDIRLIEALRAEEA